MLRMAGLAAAQDNGMISRLYCLYRLAKKCGCNTVNTWGLWIYNSVDSHVLPPTPYSQEEKSAETLIS